MRWKLCYLAAAMALVAPAFASTVTVAINSAHGASYLLADFEILKPSVTVGTEALIDRSVCDPDSTSFDPSFVSDATSNASFEFFSVLDGNDCGPPPINVQNNVPYQVLNQSFADPPTEDVNYSTLEEYDSALSLPFLGACTENTACRQPGIYSVNSTAPELNYTSGYSIEFELSNGYLGFNTTAPSWVTAGLSAIYAALRYDHPSWTVPDVTAALRQTAANWASGYSLSNFGYGIIDWASADAITSTADLYLQPPVVNVPENYGYYAQIVLYPFRQTRRAYEVVYSVNPNYSWPLKNEYTTSDITASGGTLLYTSNGTDVTPTFTYFAGASGTLTLIAFTTDGEGNYSRVESFSKITIPLEVRTACTQ